MALTSTPLPVTRYTADFQSMMAENTDNIYFIFQRVCCMNETCD